MHRFESGRRLEGSPWKEGDPFFYLTMIMYKRYTKLVSAVKGKRYTVVILLFLVLLFNLVIFPFFSSPSDPEILDTRYFYKSSDVFSYINILTDKQKTLQIIMHASADIIYPLIYSVLLGAMTAGRFFLFIPFLLLLSDLLENILVIILLTVINNSVLLNAAAEIVPFITNIKWNLAGLNAAMIVVLWIIRTAKQK